MMRGKMIWRGAGVAAAALVTASTASAQSDVKFEPGFVEGQQFRYEMNMRLGVSQTMGDAEARDSSVISTASVQFTVTNVAKNGAVEAKMNVERVTLEGEMNGARVGYHWPVQVGNAFGDAELNNLGKVLCGSTIEIFISPNGIVGVSNGLDDFVEAAQNVAGTDSRLLGFFNPQTLATSLTPLFTCDGARAKLRDKGDVWTTTDLVPIPPIGLMDVDTTFNFNSFDRGMASYSGETTFKFHQQGQPSADMASIEILKQSGTTQGLFDTTKSLMRNRTNRTIVRTRWSLGEMWIEQTQDATVTVRLLDAN